MNRINQIDGWSPSLERLLAAVRLGKRKNKPRPGVLDPRTTETVKARPAGSAVGDAGQQAGMEESLLRLTDIRLTPAPLTAADDLTAEPIPLAPLPEGVTFEFRWYVDGKALEEASGPMLERSAYKKKQWVFCEVRAVRETVQGPGCTANTCA